MRKLPLERGRTYIAAQRVIEWKSCAPFVENTRGKLIHRPREARTYHLHSTGPHVGLRFWCGTCLGLNEKYLVLHDQVPQDRVVCAHCEENAVAAGLPSAESLTGRHVHIGGVDVVKHCCKEGNEK